jgi:nicotinamide-nucleotide amidase
MKAELIAVGSELLGTFRPETNTLWLTDRLRELGLDVTARVTVADDAGLLASVVRGAVARADVVVATGGLGPTEDDLTRDAVAAALGRPLVREERLVRELEERFARYGRRMAPVNAKQADVIEGAEVLPNPRGTAPGQYLEAGGRVVVLLPGPPAEMQPLFTEEVRPRLAAKAGPSVLRTRVLRIAAMGESDVEQLVAPVYTTFRNPRTTILGGASQVELHLTAEGRSSEEAEAAIEALASQLRPPLAGRIFSEDGRELPAVVAGLLRAAGQTLAVAESCTGGLLAARLTDVPGSSAFFERGFVTYSNRAKTEELGVPAELVARTGAVSEEVAAAMAAGVRRVAGTHWGVGITGIAGPDGGTPDKPVGLVHVAVEGPEGLRARRLHLFGERVRVRQQAAQVALEMLRRELLRLPPLG